MPKFDYLFFETPCIIKTLLKLIIVNANVDQSEMRVLELATKRAVKT
jgi:hypothetical protein